MDHRHVPRLFLPFAVLAMFGPLPVMLLEHDPIHTKPAAVAFMAILLVAVARRSVAFYTLLLGWNVFLGLSAALEFGSGMTVGAPLLALLGLGCAAMQLAPSMRDHVGLTRRQTLSRPSPTSL